jgi:hypothetical protein
LCPKATFSIYLVLIFNELLDVWQGPGANFLKERRHESERRTTSKKYLSPLKIAQVNGNQRGDTSQDLVNASNESKVMQQLMKSRGNVAIWTRSADRISNGNGRRLQNAAT